MHKAEVACARRVNFLPNSFGKQTGGCVISATGHCWLLIKIFEISCRIQIFYEISHYSTFRIITLTMIGTQNFLRILKLKSKFFIFTLTL